MILYNTHVDQYSAGPKSASEGFSVIYVLYNTIQHYIILHVNIATLHISADGETNPVCTEKSGVTFFTIVN